MNSPADTPKLFERVRAPRAFEEIADQIRLRLIEGKLQIGTRMPSQRALADQFGVSRNTLREALRSLENAGLLQLRGGATGGAFIQEGSAEAVSMGLMDMFRLGGVEPADLTEARIWLESAVVRAACECATEEDVQLLRSNIVAAVAADRAGDVQSRAKLHMNFHRLLGRATGNPLLVAIMDAIIDVMEQFISRIGPNEQRSVVAARKRFMKHFEARDADRAVKEMEKSLRQVHRDYLSRIETAS